MIGKYLFVVPNITVAKKTRKNIISIVMSTVVKEYTIEQPRGRAVMTLFAEIFYFLKPISTHPCMKDLRTPWKFHLQLFM